MTEKSSDEDDDENDDPLTRSPINCSFPLSAIFKGERYSGVGITEIPPWLKRPTDGGAFNSGIQTPSRREVTAHRGCEHFFIPSKKKDNRQFFSL